MKQPSQLIRFWQDLLGHLDYIGFKSAVSQERNDIDVETN